MESPLSRFGDVLLSVPQVYEQLTYGTSPSHDGPSRMRAQLKFLRYNLHYFSLGDLPEVVSLTLRSFIRLLDCHENGMKIRTIEIDKLLDSSAFKTLVVDLGYVYMMIFCHSSYMINDSGQLLTVTVPEIGTFAPYRFFILHNVLFQAHPISRYLTSPPRSDSVQLYKQMWRMARTKRA